MSSKRLAFVAAALAGALGLAACGGTESPAAEAPASEPAPTSTEAAEPEPPEAATTQEATTTEETTTTEEPPGPATLDVRIEHGEAVGGTKTLEVEQGDAVRIRVAVDEPQELHLHGYEIEKEAEPGKPVVFRFTADLEGIFELESHHSDTTLVRLVVNP
jgi:FtsP/CotA-like multicopper oxidase with cupredoxin domain